MFEQIGKLTFKVIEFLNFKKKAQLRKDLALKLSQQRQKEQEELEIHLRSLKKKEIKLDFRGTKPLNVKDLLSNTDMLLKDSGIFGYVNVTWEDSMNYAGYILRMKQINGYKAISYQLDYNQFIGCDNPYELYRGILGSLYRKLMYEQGEINDSNISIPRHNVVIKNITGE